ncbi:hypothetical protein Amme3_00017 [Pseudomonas phage vB_PpuM-Amme-3]|uniref:Tape measure protein N-terminal domain-containing protein n=1 Tax=Pseudomonas phage vB_PpuM-Amme-3 TaxID=3132617 RepID=A0AAX4MWB7_9CAUD
MIAQEIARLTGTLKFNVDNRPLMAFEKRLEKVTGMLQQFGAAANKKFNIKVSLDSRSLRAQLEKAANAKIVFKHFSVDEEAISGIAMKIKQRLGNTPVVLRGIQVNLTDLIEQRKVIRTTLGKMSLQLPVTLRMKEAESQLRAWKKGTEAKYKLHINADISQAKFLANVRKSLRAASGKVGEMKLDIKDPKVRLQIDKDNLREQIRKAIEQHAFKVRVDANTRTSGHSGGVSSRSGAVGGGIMGAGMGFMRGAIPGLGAAFALSQLNQINQQLQGQNLAMTAVTGSEQAGMEQTDWLRGLADRVGFDFRQVGPSYNKLLASGLTSGSSTESVQNIFQGVTEYGRVMGLDNESMKGSLRAIEQIMNKGQVMSEELKGQLAERLPGAISAMAEAAGFGSDDQSVAKLFKAMENGEVKSQAVLEKFSNILAARARQGGALEKAMETTAAQQARFNNAFSRSVEVFSAAGFDKGMGSFFKALADGLDTAEPMIKALGEAFNYLIEPVNAVINVGAHIVKWLTELSGSMNITSGQMAAIGIAAGALLLPFGGILAVVGTLALAFDDLITYMDGGESVLGSWLESTPEAKEAFNGLAAEAKEFGQNIKEAFDELVSLSGGLEGLNFSDMLISTMKELKAILESFNNLVERFKASAAFAKTNNETGTTLEANIRTIQGLALGADEAYKRANDATAASVQQRTVHGSADVPGGQSLNKTDIESIVTAAIAAQNQSSELLDKPVEVNLTMQIDGMINSGDLASMVQEPMTKIAQQAFTQAIENARARQKDYR